MQTGINWLRAVKSHACVKITTKFAFKVRNFSIN